MASTSSGACQTIELSDDDDEVTSYRFSKATRKITYKLSSSKLRKCTSKLALMCIVDMLPPSIVEGIGFLELVKGLNPAYVVPSKQRLENLLFHLYHNERRNLKKELASSPAIALSCFHWTNPLSFYEGNHLSLSVYMIDENWTRQSFMFDTLAIGSCHENLHIFAELLSHTLLHNDININNIKGVVANTIANQIPVEDMFAGSYLQCFGKTLDIIIQKALQSVDSFKQTIGKTSTMVNNILNSNSLGEIFRQYQKSLKFPLLRLTDKGTTWISIYLMLECVLKQHIPIHKCLTDYVSLELFGLKVRDIELSDNCWKILEILVCVLEPIFKATQLLCTKEYAPVSEVYPIVYGLKRNLQPKENEFVPLTELKNIIITGFEECYDLKSDVKCTSFALGCTFLDPRFKNLPFLNQEERNAVQSNIVKVLEETYDCKPVVESNESSSDISINTKKPDLEVDFIFGDMFATYPEAKPISKAEEEIKMYLESAPSPINSNPLQFWKANVKEFPLMSGLAKQMLCIPATSVPGKELFTPKGFIFEKRRILLDPATMKQIIFLRSRRSSVSNYLLSADLDALNILNRTNSTVQHKPVREEPVLPIAGPFIALQNYSMSDESNFEVDDFIESSGIVTDVEIKMEPTDVEDDSLSHNIESSGILTNVEIKMEPTDVEDDSLSHNIESSGIVTDVEIKMEPTDVEDDSLSPIIESSGIVTDVEIKMEPTAEDDSFVIVNIMD